MEEGEGKPLGARELGGKTGKQCGSDRRWGMWVLYGDEGWRRRTNAMGARERGVRLGNSKGLMMGNHWGLVKGEG